MTCPRCQRENADGMTFCGACGARLVGSCPACGASVPSTDRFCGRCGAALGRGEPDTRFGSPQTYTPKHLAERILSSRAALEGERKQVTVLFADMKGSMELLADRDPEDARKILDPVLELMMDAVHRYEGTVNQVMGDGIMALFGAPVGHEDHAVRACYAALRMQEAVRRHAADVQRRAGVPLQIRIGLNSGEVVVRSIGSDLRLDYTAVGQTTHLAARMEQLAMAGSILLTGRTRQLAEGFIEVKPLGPVPVKGLEQPIEVSELIGAGPARTRVQAAAGRGLTRFVGRDAEVDALRRALERAGQGHGQVVAIMGEPGVGKSRLFWEFTRSSSTRDWLVLASTSVSHGKATAYLPLTDLLRVYFAIEARDDGRKVREKVTGKVLALDRALEPVLAPILALLDAGPEDRDWNVLDPPQRRRRTLDACKWLLLRESQEQPLCLVFEDLHWIDGETQAFLDSLVESLPGARVLLLVNYRPEYEHAWGRKSFCTQLRLDPLPPASAAELLDTLLGTADGALGPLKALLIRRTDGNPFFLEESVWTLVETGVLTGQRGAYRAARPIDELTVPATVHAMLAARIDRLPPADKRLLQAASVIGKDVPLALLEVIADRGPDDLLSGLVALQGAEFLYETRLFPDIEYTFKHALTHDVAYRSLLRGTRQAYHRRIAEGLEERVPATAETQPELLAHHYAEAGLTDKAVQYCAAAGHRASGHSAHREAVRHLARGLELLQALPEGPDRDRRELQLQRLLATPLIATRGYGASEVERLGHRAHVLGQRLGEPQGRRLALSVLWQFYLVHGPIPKALEVAEEYFELSGTPGAPPGVLTGAHMMLAQTLRVLGKLRRGLAHAEEGIALYHPEQHSPHALRNVQDLGVTLLSDAALLLLFLGYPDQALARGHQAMALARRLRHPYTLSWGLGMTARLRWALGDVTGTEEASEEQRRVAAEYGFAFQEAQARFLASGVALERDAGTLGDERLETMQQALAAMQAIDALLLLPRLLAILADGCARLGRLDEGLARVDEALTLATTIGEQVSQPAILRTKGELLLARPGPDEGAAEACFRRALEIARGQEARWTELQAVVSLARLWRRQGKPRQARDLLGDLYAAFTEGRNTVPMVEAKALLDEL